MKGELINWCPYCGAFEGITIQKYPNGFYDIGCRENHPYGNSILGSSKETAIEGWNKQVLIEPEKIQINIEAVQAQLDYLIEIRERAKNV